MLVPISGGKNEYNVHLPTMKKNRNTYFARGRLGTWGVNLWYRFLWCCKSRLWLKLSPQMLQECFFAPKEYYKWHFMYREMKCVQRCRGFCVIFLFNERNFTCGSKICLSEFNMFGLFPQWIPRWSRRTPQRFPISRIKRYYAVYDLVVAQ